MRASPPVRMQRSGSGSSARLSSAARVVLSIEISCHRLVLRSEPTEEEEGSSSAVLVVPAGATLLLVIVVAVAVAFASGDNAVAEMAGADAARRGEADMEDRAALAAAAQAGGSFHDAFVSAPFR